MIPTSCTNAVKLACSKVGVRLLDSMLMTLLLFLELRGTSCHFSITNAAFLDRRNPLKISATAI